MSTKEHHGHDANGAPVHSDVTFEPRDIDIGTIARYLVYLAITIVIAPSARDLFISHSVTPLPCHMASGKSHGPLPLDKGASVDVCRTFSYKNRK